ncbi:adenylyltransferase/cytidyltransferase family protein [Streptomyces sp. NPDC059783]|uniref:adenylyltransferase/cytidyltransferase family protein n=1 Tax=Streptomyces sp. NPDC059783 TaxID=3346944 RepID=UPI0036528009
MTMNATATQLRATRPATAGAGRKEELVGYTAGVFDMLHVGHVRLLEQARERCDRLIVGVTTDELCERRKHKTPIVPYADRVAVLRALRCVDEVVPQSHMDRLAAWERLRFGITFVGDDWQGTGSWRAYEQSFARLGVEIVYFPYTTHVSSTLLRSRLKHPSAA